jgi:hypothetical protein
MIAADRSTLLCFNTVERLLRGDFFHATEPDAVVAELAAFPPQWTLVGLGTSNWYRRNGELIVGGSGAAPRFWWGDPASEPAPGRIVDLASERPPAAAAALVTPEAGKDDAQPRFPFVAVAACAPQRALTLEAPADAPFHDWFEQAMAERNVGLAAVHGDVELAQAAYTTCCHIPLGGFGPSDDVYSAFRQGTLDGARWDLRGLYALNPTLQRMVSVEGHALHLHGHAPAVALGGHLATAIPRRPTHLTVWPLQDLVLRIRDIDVAWLPVKEL